ncbi:Inosine-5'-monophosphate dehydrogenase [Rhodovulum sp. PH10]|uniref:CBS domain-containing protein n=1 Tax=Rhodovulum sp. PH10 TaxID=1187851 RepID=UPI00027C2467|nr:CBS domain-containing protein [Rhodovulum sp. PH10]EJW13366.1 Inosine-5'-monophosphate dehydrogenase [Rhodovulum sp. PH10]
MKACDVMTSRVVSIRPEATVEEAVRQMLDNRISGLPVVDGEGDLVGIVTEGDFLRRAETGTCRKRPRWLEILIGPNSLAKDYVRSHGRKVEEVMTRDPVTVTEDTTLDAIVSIMERRRVKRVPVVRGREVVGIVSRANLLHALASVSRDMPPAAASDADIRQRVLDELAGQPWAPVALVDVVVKDGVVELWGSITESKQAAAMKVCAENVPGVKDVVSHLSWIEPMSGLVISDNTEHGPRSGS